jgi:hypothetical protein
MAGCEGQAEGGSGAKATENSAAKTEMKSGTKTAGIPSGVYVTTFSNIPGKPTAPDAIVAEGPYYLCRVEIGEPSTHELLAGVEFENDNVSCFTYTNPNDNAQYWIERSFDKNGETTSVRVGSTAANVWYINVWYSTKSNGMPAMNGTVPKPENGVLSPKGEALSDPYSDPELPIAGFKELKFRTSQKDGYELRGSFDQAGYNTSDGIFEKGIYSFKITPKLTGRAKIEETMLRPKGWKVEKEGTKGNIGLYNKPEHYTGQITIDYQMNGLPFTIVIKNAQLDKLEEDEDRTSYTMSGTAEIQQKSFVMEDLVFNLKDQQQKSFSEEHAFQVSNSPDPGVSWDYVETWEYVEEKYNTPFLLTVIYSTRKSPTASDYITLADPDKLDGSHNMTFMMPASGGTATWTFSEKK